MALVCYNENQLGGATLKILGIIAEYNPFHFGHQYQLEQAKIQSGADAIVVVMSGFFTQRGIPAIISPWQRAKSAIAHGADLVLMLPTIFSLHHADLFAQGGVSILDQLPNLEWISFGAESNDLPALQEIADVLEHDIGLQSLAKSRHKHGGNFGKTQTEALEQHPQLQALASHLKSPNNILAVAYLKAMQHYGSIMQPICIPRIGAGYLDDVLQPLASATAIRSALREGLDLKEYLPQASYDVIHEETLQGRIILTPEAFAPQILSQLHRSTAQDLRQLPETNEGLENKWLANRCSRSLAELLQGVKSKRHPYSKLQRSLFQLLLGITKADIPNRDQHLPYALVLAFNATGQKVLASWRDSSPISLITRPCKQSASLEEYGQRLLEIDRRASELWNLALPLEARVPGQWLIQQPIRYGLGNLDKKDKASSK